MSTEPHHGERVPTLVCSNAPNVQECKPFTVATTQIGWSRWRPLPEPLCRSHGVKSPLPSCNTRRGGWDIIQGTLCEYGSRREIGWSTWRLQHTAAPLLLWHVARQTRFLLPWFRGVHRTVCVLTAFGHLLRVAHGHLAMSAVFTMLPTFLVTVAGQRTHPILNVPSGYNDKE